MVEIRGHARTYANATLQSKLTKHDPSGSLDNKELVIPTVGPFRVRRHLVIMSRDTISRGCVFYIKLGIFIHGDSGYPRAIGLML